MLLSNRIQLLCRMGNYMQSSDSHWLHAKTQAQQANPWFTPDSITRSVANIATTFLQPQQLTKWANTYVLPERKANPKNIGIVMASNIPLVGFHDFLCAFMVGHSVSIKPSSKDEILIQHLANKLLEWNSELVTTISFPQQLLRCDAYIATGSNNSGRYFQYYFNKYPNIIRKNKTSVAVLTGNETGVELDFLADDIQLYFGLGCRNVTKLYVPPNYDFQPLLNALKKYDHYFLFHKYKHNYDYQLTLLLMNRIPYLTNESILLTENTIPFSPVSQLHYEFYDDKTDLLQALQIDNNIQCIVEKNNIPFGQTQTPTLMDYADGVDTIAFLQSL